MTQNLPKSTEVPIVANAIININININIQQVVRGVTFFTGTMPGFETVMTLLVAIVLT